LILFLILLGAQPLISALRLPRIHQSTCAEPFFVEVAGGDIRFPGVYVVCGRSDLQRLPATAGARGGFTGFPAVLVNRLDLAKGPKLTVWKTLDGHRFSLSEIRAHQRVTLGIPLSLNDSSEEELTAIPGVGPGIARAIAQERALRGRFRNLDELLRVRGIGPKLYARMKRYLIP
jgi:competence ComEA-like helix-hairpin-helix protein